MRNLIFLLILGIALAEIKVIPYPKHVESGSETAEFSRCELNLESSLDKSFAEIIDIHKEIIFGDQTSCLPNTPRPITVKIEQRKPLDDSECTSEEYELEVTKQGIFMSSACPVGLIRALATLEMLIQKRKESIDGKVVGEIIVIEDVPLKIKDSPRFGYRGLMLDSARHFVKINTIKRVIDGMMLAKLNVLHWHIVDDDSFPMQSVNIPGLGEAGAFDPKELYTAKDIKDLVLYGKTRGVRLVPEIDVPGHSRAVGKYKQLNDMITCFNSIWPHNLRDYYRIRGGPPTAALDPSMDKTYQFMEKIFKDLNEYFVDELIHLGGDEVMYSCWRARQSIMDFKKRQGFVHDYELMTYFIKRSREVLKKITTKKKTIYWFNNETPGLRYPPGDILQYWGHSDKIKDLEKNHTDNKYILSPYDFLYLDCGVGNKYGGPSWCGVYKTWLKIYEFEPTNYGITESKILGAEGVAWAEQIDEANVELKFWPRAVALAETLWMPKRTGPINMVSILKRLNEFSKKVNERGEMPL